MDITRTGAADEWQMWNGTSYATDFGSRTWLDARTLQLADPGTFSPPGVPQQGEYDQDSAPPIRAADGALWPGGVFPLVLDP